MDFRGTFGSMSLSFVGTSLPGFTGRKGLKRSSN